jgi:uncharacterized metal-binding protein YceD (DUF177 family)
MGLLVPLAALQKGPVQLDGELTPEALGLETLDPCIEANQAVRYELKAHLMGRELFVEGTLETTFNCRCVRCLRPFDHLLRIDPWQFVLDLDDTEEPVPVVNESVDLTPQVREDSLLALPQHPVCSSDCRGLPSRQSDTSKPEGLSDGASGAPSAWSILDTLKLD